MDGGARLSPLSIMTSHNDAQIDRACPMTTFTITMERCRSHQHATYQSNKEVAKPPSQSDATKGVSTPSVEHHQMRHLSGDTRCQSHPEHQGVGPRPKRPSRAELVAIRNRLKLTRVQRDVLVGLLLGDGHLQTQDGGGTYRLVYSQGGGRKLAYLNHVHHLFTEWALTPPRRVPPRSWPLEGVEEFEGKRFENGESWAFSTVSHGSLRFYGKGFYRNGKKVVPKTIHRLLTSRGLAYWYMDDGSIKSKQSKGVILNTHSFSLSEVERLCGALQSKMLIVATPRPQRVGGEVRHHIYISGRSYERLAELICPFLLPEMMYKFPPPRRPRKGRGAGITG